MPLRFVPERRLAKRIVEENHGGKLLLANTEQGATFEIILQ